MPTTVQIIQDLSAKIAAAKLENAKFTASLEDDTLPGGSWKTSLKNNCGVTWSPTLVKPGSWPYKKATVDVATCNNVWDIIAGRTAKIAQNNIDIQGWEAQIDSLLQDPNIQKDLADAENQRFINRILTYAGIAIVLIAAGLFIWWKWFKK